MSQMIPNRGQRRHGAARGWVAALGVALVIGAGAVHAEDPCIGDCDGNGEVVVSELVTLVAIALESLPLSSCSSADANGDGAITVDEIVSGVHYLLERCPRSDTPTPTPTATPEDTAVPTPTATASPSATAHNGGLSIADVVARDGDGIALRLGQSVTTEGVVTVAAGVFANNKLKIFMQEGGAGLMVYHQAAGDVEAFEPGQRLRVTGVVRQQDPVPDSNPATGTVLVDISQGTAEVLSAGNPLPAPVAVTLETLSASGASFTGVVVRVDGVRKVLGDWPAVGGRSTQVDIGDDIGTVLVMRIQRFTISPELVAKLTAIGDGPFTLSGVVVQDDLGGGPALLGGFEIWERGAGDVSVPGVQ